MLVACLGPSGRESGGAAGGAGATGGLPCEVARVLQDACASCHGATPTFGAPMPLVSHADLVAPAKSDPSRKVYELVGQRTHDDARPMPQAPAPRLSASDQKVLDDWISAGAPPSPGSCSSSTSSSSSGAGGSTTLSCTPDVHLIPENAWTMPKDTTDVYVCYGLDVTEPQKKQITAFAPRIDNAKIVHHIVLFQSDSPQPAGPVVCDLSGAKDWRPVAVWVPGNDGFELPKEAGFPLSGTTHYIVQVHYNNLAHLDGQTDKSGFDLCTTTELRPNDADVLAFGSTSFQIPAHSSLDMTCDFTVPKGVPALHAIGGLPHMHKLGTAIDTVVRPSGGGAPLDLGKRDPWNFEAQYWSPLDQVVTAGDVVSTRCAWNNTTASPVSWGENTEDEMCWSFTMYYPKIESPKWSWTLPSVTSKCAPTK
jgi:hypothetical protein